MSSFGENGSSGVTAETYGAVDASQVSEEVWLVRIPNKLAALWEEAPEGTFLGELEFQKGGKASNGKSVKPVIAVHASEELLARSESPSTSEVPLDYSFEAMTKRIPVMHPFTRKADGSVELNGTVSRTANLQMNPSDERYRQLLKNRLLKNNVTSNRFVRPVEANELSVRKSHSSALASSRGFGDAVRQFGQKVIEASEGGGDNSRKRKFEGKTTQTIVFELFSQQPRWTVKEMKNASGCPEKEIRQVLAEIGEFHRSGENKGTWELLPEFQKRE